MAQTGLVSRKPALRWLRLLLFLVGAALLGWVGYSLADAKLFEMRERQQFVKTEVNSVPPAEATGAAIQPASTGPTPAIYRLPAASSSVLGRIEINRIGVDAIIAEGTSSTTLRRAVGHIAGSALPGGEGNVAIAGHRDTFFRGLRNLRINDEITLTTRRSSYHYRVDSISIVVPEETTALDDSKGEALLTLVTCYPFYFVGPAPKRFIVRAHREP